MEVQFDAITNEQKNRQWIVSSALPFGEWSRSTDVPCTSRTFFSAKSSVKHAYENRKIKDSSLNNIRITY